MTILPNPARMSSFLEAPLTSLNSFHLKMAPRICMLLSEAAKLHAGMI